ncbi:MAG TPA: imidazoleglycerol-phosphate dehydratase HisB [Bacteroidetes bacterium]|nr:imidazoleglycerol-phosphate dehydratase HisB [Bacteroidota bacterium]
MRRKEILRKTNETRIRVSMNLDGTGKSAIETGVGFLDHLLALFAFHAGIDLEIEAAGDLQTDDHHIVEDIGIVMGQVLRALADDKKGLARYGYFLLPMDEVLARSVIDLSGRAYLVFAAEFRRENIGALATENIEEFFKALVREAELTLHLEILRPGNDHHQAEALFKCFGRALQTAVAKEKNGRIPSTKGMPE